MSDHARNPRKLTARVLPIEKVRSGPMAPRRPNARPALPSPAARTRAYGAPLAAASRLPRALRSDIDAVDAPALAADASVPAATPNSLAKQWTHRGADDSQGSLNQTLSDPVVLWEQPPQPRGDAGQQPPRWMIDSATEPSEADYAQLASRVGVLLAGFADFVRAPGVVESGDWQARLPMPDTVLPETVLEMQVTPLHAKLRFETDNKVSRGVLHRYAKNLQLQVKAALDDARVVEVVLW